jgi:adenylylsulfate kinase-like enzyme
MSALKKRYPKGLYSKADKGEISNLIGYSKTNRYDVPDNADLKLDTSSSETIYLSVEIIVDFIKKNSNKTNFPL